MPLTKNDKWKQYAKFEQVAFGHEMGKKKERRRQALLWDVLAPLFPG